MTPEFVNSNLSKIKPKLRTQGRVSGNFGKNKVSAGSSLQSIGETKGSVGNLPKKEEYLNRMIEAYNKTTNPKLKHFIYEEIRKIRIQNGTWNQQ